MDDIGKFSRFPGGGQNDFLEIPCCCKGDKTGIWKSFWIPGGKDGQLFVNGEFFNASLALILLHGE